MPTLKAWELLNEVLSLNAQEYMLRYGIASNKLPQ